MFTKLSFCLCASLRRHLPLITISAFVAYNISTFYKSWMMMICTSTADAFLSSPFEPRCSRPLAPAPAQLSQATYFALTPQTRHPLAVH